MRIFTRTALATALALGLAALAVTLPAQPLIWVVAAMLLIGTGFGTSYAFLNQRVMAAAQAGQEDRRSPGQLGSGEMRERRRHAAVLPDMQSSDETVAWAGVRGCPQRSDSCSD